MVQSAQPIVSIFLVVELSVMVWLIPVKVLIESTNARVSGLLGD